MWSNPPSIYTIFYQLNQRPRDVRWVLRGQVIF